MVLVLWAIHLRRPHGGERGEAQVDACGRGRGSGPSRCPHWKFRNVRFTCEIL